MATARQIFQTTNQSRWRRFKWTFRFISILIIFFVAVLALSLRSSYLPGLPTLRDENEQYKKILHPENNFILENRINRAYAGFRKFIDKNENRKHIRRAKLNSDIPAPIRAAFYVAWDPQSFFSLRHNISHLNMIMPEWLFIDPHADTLYSNIDQRGLAVIRKAGTRVVPMLSNFYGNDFNGRAVHRIIHNPAKTERLIASVIRYCKNNHFAGINIDFEELKEKSDESLIAFQAKLYKAMHENGLLVTQDITPFNSDYNYKELAKYNDYLFLMAYDEHNSESTPGPISSQKWIEAALDEAAGQIPSGKIILCLAGYGYDWSDGGSGVDITFQEALSIAAQHKDSIEFDDNTYNLHYQYQDDNQVEHQVYFTDAATNYNVMRFAAEYAVGGTALWRMGSEDSRIWNFYDKDMSRHARNLSDSSFFTSVGENNDVDYIGEGEILDVKSNPQKGSIHLQMDNTDLLLSEEHYTRLPSMFVVKKYGKADKKMVLSFDDGPDPSYTPRILDILSKEHVPAVFFLVGINAENNIPLVKRIYQEGHELGNHSFTHPNMAEVSENRARLERRLTRLLIESITGHSTLLFRAPYNADSEPETMEEMKPVADSRTENYLTVGESIDPTDWEPGVSADSIVARVIAQQDNGSIILLHDAGGNREATIKALPRIIHYFKSKGYTFTSIADLLGKSRNDLMPAVSAQNGYKLIQLNYYLASIGYYASHILSILFILFIILGLTKIITMAVLALRRRRKEKNVSLPVSVITKDGSEWPYVDIIVPAYNEEVNVVRTVQSLLESNYSSFGIIVVDDGSKDKTYEHLNSAFKGNPSVQLFSKPNGGKASALNFGILQSAADFVVCIDADTQLDRDAIRQLMQHCKNPGIGAVAGNVKVGNEINLLTRWQSIEYITGQNFDRKAMAMVNAITVVPGAIGAFRKEAIENAGGFTSDTLAEDCDLTVRIIKAGYRVEDEPGAIAYTEAPESLGMFLKQRFRWSFGVLQTFWKHRNIFLNSDYGWLGCFAWPNVLLFQFIIPLFTPLADLLMVIGLNTGSAGRILPYYLLFQLIDLGLSLLAFSFEKEKPGKLILLIPQRIIYRWLMVYVLFKTFFRTMRGELQGWGLLKRSGHVRLKPATTGLSGAGNQVSSI